MNFLVHVLHFNFINLEYPRLKSNKSLAFIIKGSLTLNFTQIILLTILITQRTDIHHTTYRYTYKLVSASLLVLVHSLSKTIVVIKMIEFIHNNYRYFLLPGEIVILLNFLFFSIYKHWETVCCCKLLT